MAREASRGWQPGERGLRSDGRRSEARFCLSRQEVTMSSRSVSVTGAVAVCAGAAVGASVRAEAPDWVCVTEHVAWAPRDSCGEVVHAGRMWLMGGWFNSNSIGPRDVGAPPTASTGAWSPRRLAGSTATPTSLVYRDRIWFMGAGMRGACPNPASNRSELGGWRPWECVTRRRMEPTPGGGRRVSRSPVVAGWRRALLRRRTAAPQE